MDDIVCVGVLVSCVESGKNKFKRIKLYAFALEIAKARCRDVNHIRTPDILLHIADWTLTDIHTSLINDKEEISAPK